MCDSDAATTEYFKKHLELMKELGQNTEYISIQTVDDFFNTDVIEGVI